MRSYTLPQLLAAYQTVRANPDREFRIDYGETMTGLQWRAWFRQCLHRKISNEAPRGRKDCQDWDRSMRHAARALNTPRLRVHFRSIPLELRARMAHRTHDGMED